ncbi:symmetrical bis(5'-nucleosyl)-tetraphosphatase [Agaribacterium sp. ZY112]|uniref:symmetrical bis(5'-nucleosyl)-tetraphosphatase n=1 Tax=Agaribacterium sp. ZY112 TaxID=3233574 RepID=UPI0035256EE4
MATYVVGDIQGCLEPLLKLLKKVDFSEDDVLWCAGDLINRGPDNLATLRFLKELGPRCKVVLGNHDLHLLACWKGQRSPGKKDNFDDVLEAKDADKLLKWLIKQPLIHRDKKLGYAMVHAGIPPQWSLKKALKRAAEVEKVLRSKKAEAFFAHMYGNEPNRWSKDLKGMDRLRVITNYFTRMRFCAEDGSLELESKCAPSTPPKGFAPWFSFKKHRARNKRILFGHWAALLGATNSHNFIGLDTGCVWGGELTMIRLEDSELFCLDCSL